MTLIAHRLGEAGFVRFLGQLIRLGVLTSQEKLGWLALHGAVMRATLPPLDDGDRFDQSAFADLGRDLGAT